MYHRMVREGTGHPMVTFHLMDQADIGPRTATFPQMEVEATGLPQVMSPRTDQEGIGPHLVMFHQMAREVTGPRVRKAVAGGSLGNSQDSL